MSPILDLYLSPILDLSLSLARDAEAKPADKHFFVLLRLAGLTAAELIGRRAGKRIALGAIYT